MPHEKLTRANVDRLGVLPGKARTLYFDTDRDAPRGFCLRVTSSGARSYYLARRVRGLGRMEFARIARRASPTRNVRAFLRMARWYARTQPGLVRVSGAAIDPRRSMV